MKMGFYTNHSGNHCWVIDAPNEMSHEEAKRLCEEKLQYAVSHINEDWRIKKEDEYWYNPEMTSLGMTNDGVNELIVEYSMIF